MIEDLVARGFAIRDAAHLEHWATDSYSQHVALGEFYDGVIEKIDGIVEAYQGWFALLKKVPREPLPTGDITEAIGLEAQWIADNRKEIARGNTMLENLLDDYAQLYSTTYYKLSRLR